MTRYSIIFTSNPRTFITDSPPFFRRMLTQVHVISYSLKNLDVMLNFAYHYPTQASDLTPLKLLPLHLTRAHPPKSLPPSTRPKPQKRGWRVSPYLHNSNWTSLLEATCVRKTRVSLEIVIYTLVRAGHNLVNNNVFLDGRVCVSLLTNETEEKLTSQPRLG